jgi:hypothetical protein
VEKYARARQATDVTVTRHMRIACWITKATDTRCFYLSLSMARMVTRTHLILHYAYIACLVKRTSPVWKKLTAVPLGGERL